MRLLVRIVLNVSLSMLSINLLEDFSEDMALRDVSAVESRYEEVGKECIRCES